MVGDVTERSVMVVGLLPPPLLGVSSLDWAPLALAGGAFFIFHNESCRCVSRAQRSTSRAFTPVFAGYGGALQTPISGLPEIGAHMRASRASPTCVDHYGPWRPRISGAPLHFVSRCTASGTRGLSGSSLKKKARRPQPAHDVASGGSAPQ